MLGVHCCTTPYLALGLLTLATFQLTFLSQECLLSTMKSPGLVSFYEKRDPLNTSVFSPNTKTGVQATTSASISPGLFKYSELQKEVTLKNLTTSYGNVNFPDARVDGQ